VRQTKTGLDWVEPYQTIIIYIFRASSLTTTIKLNFFYNATLQNFYEFTELSHISPIHDDEVDGGWRGEGGGDAVGGGGGNDDDNIIRFSSL